MGFGSWIREVYFVFEFEYQSSEIWVAKSAIFPSGLGLKNRDRFQMGLRLIETLLAPDLSCPRSGQMIWTVLGTSSVTGGRTEGVKSGRS